MSDNISPGMQDGYLIESNEIDEEFWREWEASGWAGIDDDVAPDR